MEASSWKALFTMAEIGDEHSDRFGKTFRKALSIFLTQKRDTEKGSLTAAHLRSIGIAVNSLGGDEIVIENIFPLENKETAKVDEQLNKMVELLAPRKSLSDDEYKNTLEYKAARLSVNLAFKAAEAGFVGADLDADATGKEIMYRLLHSRIYRQKYVYQNKEAGSPLSVEDIDKVLLPYFDMIILGNGRTFRQTILDSNINEDDLGRAIGTLKDRPDYIYYDSALKWGTDIWNILTKGTQVPWESLLRKGSREDDRVEEIEPEYAEKLRDIYKKLGYWTGGFTPLQLQAIVTPQERAFPDSTMSILYGRFKRDIQNHYGDTKAINNDNAAFLDDTTRFVLRRLVYREIQQYGEDYNESARSFDMLKPVYGNKRLTTKDRRRIRELLVNEVSKSEIIKKLDLQYQAKQEDDQDGVELGKREHAPLFDDDVVEGMFAMAKVTTKAALGHDVIDLAMDIAEKAAFLKARGHH
jgi:hypothetical protein